MGAFFVYVRFTDVPSSRLDDLSNRCERKHDNTLRRTKSPGPLFDWDEVGCFYHQAYAPYTGAFFFYIVRMIACETVSYAPYLR